MMSAISQSIDAEESDNGREIDYIEEFNRLKQTKDKIFNHPQI